MYTIGQFARIGMVSTNTLRYYDEIKLLSPAYVDPENQYRYYDKSQVSEIMIIVELKEMGLSLAEVKDMVENNDLKLARKILVDKLDELDIKLREISNQKRHIKEKIKTLETGQELKTDDKEYKVELIERGEQVVLSCRERINMANISSLIGKGYEKLHKYQHTSAGPHMSIYHDREFELDNADVEICIPVNQKANMEKESIKKIKKGLYAVTIYEGGYSSIGKAHAAVFDWIEDNNYIMTGPCMEIYVEHPAMGYNGFKTEVCYPVVER